MSGTDRVSNANAFVFGRNFREPEGGNPKLAAALAEAEARGRAAGLRDGQALAEAETARRLADALQRLGDAAQGLLAAAEDRGEALEREGVALALAFARKLAGEALAKMPLEPVAEAARDALQHLRGVPHLAVRVHDALVEDVDALMKRMARERGFEGRIVTLGDPDIAPGDVRLEWADGGIVREAARIAEAAAVATGSPP